ncbi:NTPase, partial [Campylobacter coli]
NINPEIKKDLNNQLGTYKPKVYDEMLDGTFKALKNLSEVANKDIGVMISEFANSYSETREKFEKKQINKKSFFKEKMNEFFKKKLIKFYQIEKLATKKHILDQGKK